VTREPSILSSLREKLLNGETTPQQVAAEALQKSNQNARRNVYLVQDRDWTLREAERAERTFSQRERPPLYGLPISLKDCFDLQGFLTTAGAKFYAERNQRATADSAVAARQSSTVALCGNPVLSGATEPPRCPRSYRKGREASAYT